jgi:hypothetical protein
LFVDAAHFVLQPFLGFLWCFRRVFIQAASGRQRFNVLAALHLTSLQVVSVTHDSYINAQSVCALLTKLHDAFADLPITLVLDNARYQQCRTVIDLAAALEIELLFLPPYSPNLNLIERLWKFIRQECLATVYFDTFQPFTTAIVAALSQTQGKYKSQLQSLLVPNFQTFDNVTSLRS